MKRARDRTPSVVVFEEPGKGRQKTSFKRKKVPEENDKVEETNFKKISQEVRDFGITGFTKRDQRRFQQQKAQLLGAKAPKRQKVPYPILMRAKKIRDQRETEQKELEMAMGIFKKKKKSQKSNNLPKGFGRWVEHSKGLDGGKYKKGIQTLQQKDIAKFKKKK